MAAGNWVFTNSARTKLLSGQFATGDTYKMALFLSTSNLGAASTTFAGVTNEHGTTSTGYTAGGIAITFSVSGTTTVTVDIATDPVWTALTNGLTAKWAAIYEVGGDVVCYATLDSGGADVSATNGNTLTVAANAAGVYTLA